MDIDACLKKVSDQKALIKQLKSDKETFDNSVLGKNYPYLVDPLGWVRVMDIEESVLAKFRAKLSEARGE